MKHKSIDNHRKMLPQLRAGEQLSKWGAPRGSIDTAKAAVGHARVDYFSILGMR